MTQTTRPGLAAVAPCPTGLTDICTIGNHCLSSLPDAKLGEVDGAPRTPHRCPSRCVSVRLRGDVEVNASETTDRLLPIVEAGFPQERIHVSD